MMRLPGKVGGLLGTLVSPQVFICRFLQALVSLELNKLPAAELGTLGRL